MTPGTVRRMTLAVGLGLLLTLALTSTVALAQGGSPPAGGYDYTVQPGDSWLTLSGRTNIPIADLKAAEPAAQHPYGWLWQGERLFIPARTAPTPGRQACPTPSATAAGYWYQVQKGDTWQTVAGPLPAFPCSTCGMPTRCSCGPIAGSTSATGFGFQKPQCHQRLLRAAHVAPTAVGAPAATATPVATATRTPTVKASPTVAVTAVAITTQPAIGIVVTATKPTAPPPTSTPPGLAGWPAEVLTLINEKRVSAGVPALVWSPVLRVQPRPMPTTARSAVGGATLDPTARCSRPGSRSGLCGPVGQRDLGQGPFRAAGVRDVVE